MIERGPAYVYRPSTLQGVLDVFEVARTHDRSVAPRGTGYSYGDASLNDENLVLDLTRMNRVLEWNPETGRITVEPGVTVRQLWEHVIEDGWWPPVVPGAMYPTIGGIVAVNAHGKNNWKAGSIAEHVVELEFLSPTGDLLTCSPRCNRETFLTVIGGLGLLGVLLRITLQMSPIRSGLLNVEEVAVGSMEDMFAAVVHASDSADYTVGWIDAFARGAALGRGLVQAARHAADDDNSFGLRAESQLLPDTVLGLVPRSRLWLAMKATVNDPAMHLLNGLRFNLGKQRSGRTTRVPHAQFQFFHDFVPGWQRSFLPGGILQYQIFVPDARAASMFAELLREAQGHGLVPYLTVFKRHREDITFLRYNVDGFSLSLDFHPTPETYQRLRKMLTIFTRDVVIPSGGRFYFAKDNLLDSESTRRMLGPDVIAGFLELKQRMDPESLLQTNLFRRVLSPRV